MSANDQSGSIEDRILLPEEWSDFFERDGVLPATPSDRRRFPRRRIRKKVVLAVHATLSPRGRVGLYRAYTRDISRAGISFVHAEQLFPGDRVSIKVGEQHLRTVVVRCRRHGRQCYVVGAIFQRGD